MNEYDRFRVCAFEYLKDMEGMDGLDEVMYQACLMVSLARAEADASPRTLRDDTGIGVG